MLKYYVDWIDNNRVIPSPTTLYRHRLTLHMAMCLRAQYAHQTLLLAGGVVRWGTMDSSPQSGRNWIMVGFATVALDDLGQCLRHSRRLWELRQSEDEGELEVAAGIMEALRAKIAFTPSIPTTVGSGRGSLAGKLHAMIHGCKLAARTWSQCASLLNSCISWTGDLGTEAGVTACRTNLRQLFGDWIEGQDNILNPLAEPDGGFEEPDGGFQFQAEHVVPPGVLLNREPDDFSQDDKYSVSWSHSFFVPGVLHVIHNCTEDLKNSLIGWDDFVKNLRHCGKYSDGVLVGIRFSNLNTRPKS